MRTPLAVMPIVSAVVGAGHLEIGAADLLNEAGDGWAVDWHIECHTTSLKLLAPKLFHQSAFQANMGDSF